jgi:hypothetical protein
VLLEIASDGEKNRRGKCRVDRGWRGLRPAQRLAREGARVSCNSVHESNGHEQRGQRVVSKSFCKVPVKKSGQGTCGSATWTENVQIVVDRALRIEAVVCGWEA